MYYIEKEIEISASHRLELDYESPCTALHGHNWHIRIYCKSETLDRNGMVVDFKLIKERITAKLDHKMINEVLDFNPTSENLARWICDEIPHCYKVRVQESSDNLAIYEKDC